ncbi:MULTISPECIES: right-handed parallel beta-helix repeat-containing protein [Actinoalloteichus]|uniref:DUF1565 family protein/Right handed beta helix region n=1 Tax=Actinoalloteichus fjordicus TaxID=1612552 RepID=A0AAC9LDJ7_9PSEU|nr:MULTISPECIES: right-handed parallel beta-helix repeat-containing protein [Actinoalloteichus]APU14717.1 putative DUF1565 family protein/Right handed beta helix region [Actinoalloteichus fjordicus]APU20685.1 putative DUF1565 family protein/Right handed beta helix region [Actinoalloteichus sp. GBA129-24]
MGNSAQRRRGRLRDVALLVAVVPGLLAGAQAATAAEPRSVTAAEPRSVTAAEPRNVPAAEPRSDSAAEPRRGTLADQDGLIVVAPDGDDANPGTIDEPLRGIQRAVDLAEPGDVIALRGGTYALSTNIQILHSGEPDAPITLTAYQGERAVIDGDALPASHTPVGGSIPRPQRGAIHQERAAFWIYRDLEIIRGPYGIYCDSCDDTIFDRLITRDNYESGLQIQGDSSRNQVLDLDSHSNRDPRKNGESADGLAIKEGSGEGNVVRGARLWNNVDDGFDAWEFLSPILIEDSIAYGNGANRWNFPDFQGDGNGFKLGGGDGPPTDHVVRNNIAFDNEVAGFIDNNNQGTHVVDRNSSYANGGYGFRFNRSSSVLTDNLSVGDDVPIQLGDSTGSGNSWDRADDWEDSDLFSVDPSTISGPRDADGGIPTSNFLVPRDHSDLGARF